MAVLLCCFVPLGAHASGDFVTRRDGFLLVWSSILRPAEDVRGSGYEDVLQGSVGYKEITFAKYRGLTIDGDRFSPDAPLVARDAVIWLLRTRNLEPIDASGNTEFMKVIDPDDAPLLADKYGINRFEPDHVLKKAELEALIRTLDTALRNEVREASLYSEKFHGKGTAFGETFDMHALTAAHRSYPHNTLVRVTNVENKKSVIVRINDRGPFIQGRDIDLSLGAFLRIAERSKGRIDVTFDRLGDVSLVQPCGNTRLQRRITRDVVLSPGIPGTLALGSSLQLTASRFFVVRGMRSPDADWAWMQQWVEPGEEFVFTPTVAGVYEVRLGTTSGRERVFAMEVAECAG